MDMMREKDEERECLLSLSSTELLWEIKTEKQEEEARERRERNQFSFSTWWPEFFLFFFIF